LQSKDLWNGISLGRIVKKIKIFHTNFQASCTRRGKFSKVQYIALTSKFQNITLSLRSNTCTKFWIHRKSRSDPTITCNICTKIGLSNPATPKIEKSKILHCHRDPTPVQIFGFIEKEIVVKSLEKFVANLGAYRTRLLRHFKSPKYCIVIEIQHLCKFLDPSKEKWS
jgi:hypothetical protein